MKTLKLFNRFLTLIMVLTALGFSSCSKDEEPEGEKPTEDAGGRRLVSKIEFVSEVGEDDFTIELFYNKDGSLKKITNDEDELIEATFTRIENKLIIKSDYGKYGIETQTCTLNEDGYVASAIYRGEEPVTYQYQNGFLNGCYQDQSNWKVTWQNGDLLKMMDMMENYITNCT